MRVPRPRYLTSSRFLVPVFSFGHYSQSRPQLLLCDLMGHCGPRRRLKPIAFDCFAGCGGMTQGFKDAGYRVVGAIENDPVACGVYRANHRRVHLWPVDVRNVSARVVLKKLKLNVGDLDLLGGCPPCQGFSTLRTYNGRRSVRDAQNDLIFEFQRLVLGLKPKTVMLENVPALLTNSRLTRFKTALRRAGYTIKVDILNAVDYGVPQRRRRVVLLASRVSTEVDFADALPRRRTVRHAIGRLTEPGRSRDPVHNLPENRAARVVEMIRAVPKDGGSRKELPARLRLRCHKNSDGFRDVYGRMAWDKAAPTITTGCFNPSKGRFLHPAQHRTITMREAALLQTFPKTYKFPVKYGKVRLATMIGNALPPAFIKHHAVRLLRLHATSSNAAKSPIRSRTRTRISPLGIELAATTQLARRARASCATGTA